MATNQSKPIIINEQFCKTIDVDQSQYKTLNLNDDREILVIKSCNTINKFFEVLIEKKVKTFLDDSSRCFIISADVKTAGSTDFAGFQKSLNKIKFKLKPLIIKLYDEKSKRCCIFYKNNDDNQFKICDLNELEEKIKKVTTNTLDFKLLLQIFSWGELVSFKDPILNYKLNIEREFEDELLIELSVKADDGLIVRFLNFCFEKTQNKDLLRKVLNLPNTNSASLNLNIMDNDQESYLEPGREEQLMAEFKNNKNFPITAVKNENDEAFNYIIKLNPFGLTLKDAEMASNAAINSKKYDKLLTLLKHDFPFPKNFKSILDNTDDETLEKLRELHDERKKFHEAIDRRDWKEAQTFVQQHPETCIGYSPENVSAKLAAFNACHQGPSKDRDYTVYALFLCHCFTVHDDSECHKGADLKTKKSITKAFKRFCGKDVDSHIYFIFSKCRLGHYYDYHTKQGHLATMMVKFGRFK